MSDFKPNTEKQKPQSVGKVGDKKSSGTKTGKPSKPGTVKK